MRNSALARVHGDGRQRFVSWAGVAAAAVVMAAAADAVARPVAGLEPALRPAGAPVVRQSARTPDQTAQSTLGIVTPLPAGLGFLKDQGAWYSPFSAPGMSGPYDLRQRRISSDGPRQAGE